MSSLMQPRILRLIAMAAVLAGTGYVAYAYLTYEPLPDDSTFQEEYAIVLTDAEKKDVRLEEFRGNVLIVYAWATWCPYCAEELAHLAALKDEYGDRIRIAAVNRAEPLSEAKVFAENLALGARIEFLFDESDALYKEIGGYAMPETLFIDARGDIIYHQRGPMKAHEVNEKLRELLE